MSTQPKPTGEWTVSTIDEWISLNPSTWRSVIAFEHKAALDAADDKWRIRFEQFGKIVLKQKETELAAKDELHAAALQVLERHHQKQLADEREKAMLANQME